VAAEEYDAAIEELKKSLDYLDDAPTRTALGQAQQRKRWQSLLREGQSAMAAKQWTEAIGKFKDALCDRVLRRSARQGQRMPIPGIAGRGYRPSRQGTVRSGRDEAGAGPSAEAGLTGSPGRFSGDGAKEGIPQTPGRWRRGDRSQGVAQGVGVFQPGQALTDTEEVQQRINKTRYLENLSRGKAAMDREDYASATGYLKLAKGSWIPKRFASHRRG